MHDTHFKRAFIGYYLLVLASVLAYNVAGKSSAIMYIGYIFALAFLLLFFIPYANHINRQIFFLGIFICVSGLVSVCIHSAHVFDSTRYLGLNINIIVPLIYSIIIGVLQVRKITQSVVVHVLEAFTKFSLLVVIFTLAVNANSIGKIFSPANNAYLVALKGFFPNKNMFGIFTSMAAVMSIYLSLVKRNKLYLFSVVIFALVTILSLCRAALLFLTVFCFLFFSTPLGGINTKTEKPRMVRLRGLVFFVLLILLVIWLFNTNVQQFVFNKILRVDVGDAGRSGIHEYAYDLIRENGILEYLFGYGVTELEFRIPFDLHSTYLNLFLTGGLFKLFAFIYGLLISLKYIIRGKKDLLLRVSLCCLISYIVFSLFESVVYFELGLFNFEILFLVMIIPLSYDHQSVVLEPVSAT